MSCQHCTAQSAQQSAGLALTEAVNQPGGQDIAHADDEIGKLTHAAGRGHGEMDQIFYQLDCHARKRSHTEGGDQGGQIGKVVLQKRGDDRNRKLKVHQSRRQSRQHSGHDQAADIVPVRLRRLIHHIQYPFPSGL